MRSKHARELALQDAVGSLRVGLVLLRGDLHQIAAAAGVLRSRPVRPAPARCSPHGFGVPQRLQPAGRLWAACGDSDSGALAEAFALAVGRRGPRRSGGPGRGCRLGSRRGWRSRRCGGRTGTAALSGWSPRTVNVLIGRGWLFGMVPLPAFGGGGLFGATLAGDGGLAFWFSGGNTIRGPALVLALTSTGASSRGTIFSVPSPAASRSGTLALASAGSRNDLGRAGVGLDDRRLTAARRSDIGAIGERPAGAEHRQRQNHHHRGQAAAPLRRWLLGAFLVTVLVGVGVVGIGRIVLAMLPVGI